MGRTTPALESRRPAGRPCANNHSAALVPSGVSTVPYQVPHCGDEPGSRSMGSPEKKMVGSGMASPERTRIFTPRDVVVIKRVCDAAWVQIVAREPFRDKNRDNQRQAALRSLVINTIGTGRGDFSALCDKVLLNMPDTVTHVYRTPTSD